LGHLYEKEGYMKILLLDIETAPNLAYVWGLFKQNISTSQIANSGYVLCWAAKWLGDDKVHFSSIQSRSTVSMLNGIHRLLDQADAVIHYYGTSFDIPTLNKEFVSHGFEPPAPYKQIDLCNIVKAEFRFPSSKLDYVSQALGLGSKTRHPGFEMWVKCMDGEKKAWRLMEKYNRQDVALLETLYNRLQPWIRLHPNHATFEGVKMCPKCGSEDYQARGWAYTMMMKYRRYKCNHCKGWFRGNKAVSRSREESMTNIGS
jgi:hypothetical protein